MLNKLKENLWIFRSLLPTLWFNFRHLPLKQAFKLPILLYKPRILNCSGKIEFDCPVRFGMIKLGLNIVSLYPNSGIALENKGKIIFKGKVSVGNDSAISVGPTGTLTLGDNLLVTCALKLACYDSIVLDDNVLIGWNCLFTDTDFHMPTYDQTCKDKRSYGPIHIGRNTWIANGCKLYKNTNVPQDCIIGADSILHGRIDCQPKSIITTCRETKVHTSAAYLDRTNCSIDYRK